MEAHIVTVVVRVSILGLDQVMVRDRLQTSHVGLIL